MSAKPRHRPVPAVALAVVVAFLVSACGTAQEADEAVFVAPEDALVAADTAAHLYRSATCDCCVGHADYLEAEGVDVVEHVVDDVAEVKRLLGVPDDLWSCHTTVVGGYVVEGHVPVDDIDRVLTERPDIGGIALPGMPSGSPGMPGELEGPLEVSEFGDR
jgi:hypothetical protein